MKFAKLGNILILVSSGLITVLSLTTLIVMIGLSPSLLAEVATRYIIPFALALMIPTINLFFAETFTLIGVMGVKSSQYKLIYQIGIGLVIIYIIIISVFLGVVMDQFGQVDAEMSQIAPFLIVSILSIVFSIIVLVGIILRLKKNGE